MLIFRLVPTHQQSIKNKARKNEDETLSMMMLVEQNRVLKEQIQQLQGTFWCARMSSANSI